MGSCTGREAWVTVPRGRHSEHLEQPGSTHSPANAHRHNDIPSTAPLAFDQGMPGQPCSGHAIRMTDGNCPAIDVQGFVGNAQYILTVQHLDGKGLIQFPQPDIVLAEAEA